MSIYVWANSSRTSDVVSDFYYQIKIIAEHPKDSEMSFEARNRVTDMSCDTEGSGWFPNEFVDDPNSQQKLRAYNYALTFASLSEETNPSFSYKIVSQNKYVEPEWEKNEAESNFSYTIVDKSYTYKGVKKNVRDTIIIANFTNQILGVMNKYGGYDFKIDETEPDFPNPSVPPKATGAFPATSVLANEARKYRRQKDLEPGKVARLSNGKIPALPEFFPRGHLPCNETEQFPPNP